MKALLAGLVLLLAASTATAQGFKPTTWYVGGGGGPSSMQNACSYFARFAPTCDDEAVAWKAFLGYNVYKFTALELQYMDAGTADLASASGTNTMEINPRMITTYLKFEVPVAVQGRLGLFVKFGMNYFETEYTSTPGFVGALSGTDDGIDTAMGAGFSWRGWDHLSARLEWENFNDAAVNGGDVNVGSVSLIFHF